MISRRLSSRFVAGACFVFATPFPLALPVAAQVGAIGLSSLGSARLENNGVGDLDPESGNRFGERLAIGDFNGDGADELVTGAPGYSSFLGAETESGAVFVHYSLPGIGLVGPSAGQALHQAATGNPDPPEAGDAFGLALAICDFNGDGRDDLAVGIPWEDLPNADEGGAVEIRFGSATGIASAAAQFLTQESGATPGESESNDFFGNALACGNFDGDDFADLAVGLPREKLPDANGTQQFSAGSVIVYRGSAAGVTANGSALFHQDAGALDDAVEAFDFFGETLAAGDFDGDGFDDLVVGVPGENHVGGHGFGRGAIQVLFGTAGGLTTVDDFFATEIELGGDAEAGDRMGEALAVGDFDGDGRDDLAIGSPFEDTGIGIDKAGQVIALYGASSGFDLARTQIWREDAIHGAGSAGSGDRFGFALASGDFDRDGHDDLAIGTPGELVLLPEDGLVTVVMGSPTGITAARRRGLYCGLEDMPGFPNQADRHHGHAVAAGDFDGDGYDDLAIGAPFENEGPLVDVGAEVVLYGSLFADGFEIQSSVFWSRHGPLTEAPSWARFRFVASGCLPVHLLAVLSPGRLEVKPCCDSWPGRHPRRFGDRTAIPGRSAAVLLLALIGPLIGPVGASADDGDLDPDFGTDGRALPGSGSAGAVLARADGSLRLAIWKSGQVGFLALRPDGSIDTSFGDDGFRTVPPEGFTAFYRPTAIFERPDGRLVLVASSGANSREPGKAVLVQVTADGELDPDFGTDGVRRVWHGSTTTQASAAVLQGNGKLLLAGFCVSCSASIGAETMLTRLEENGSIDTMFGDAGWVIFDAYEGGTGNDQATALAFDANGKILIAGGSGSNDEERPYVARRLANGDADFLFGGGDGILTLSALAWRRATSLVVDPVSKRILVATGRWSGPSSIYPAGVARVTASGVLDDEFGEGGIVTLDFEEGSAIQEIRLQSDRKIVGVGSVDAQGSQREGFLLVRLLTDGTLDTTFDDNGRKHVEFDLEPTGRDFATAMTLSGGRIVAVGAAMIGQAGNLALVRTSNALIFTDGFERGTDNSWNGN